MTKELQASESFPTMTTKNLRELASMCDGENFLELVWLNGQVLSRNLLSTKIAKKGHSCSDWFSKSYKNRVHCEGEASTVNSSNNGNIADSTFGDPLSGLTKLNHHQTGYPESELYEDSFNNEISEAIEIDLDQTVNSDSKVPGQKQYEGSKQFVRSGVEEKSDRVNFSIFARSPLAKSNHPSCGATTRSPTNIPTALCVGSENLEVNKRSSPRSNNSFEKEGNFICRKMKPMVFPDSESQDESYPDEQSDKGYQFVEQMVASSSLSSRGASNCPTYTVNKSYYEEDTDTSESHAMEEFNSTTKAAPAKGREGAKKKRKAEVHNLSEKRRRDKIKKKMRALQELIPNCHKVDKVSMLDEAIEYLKNLQFQVQMMSIMGNGFYNVFPNPMMLPSTRQNPLHFGMGMGMQMGFRSCVPGAHFPSSVMSGTAATLPGGIMDHSRLNMLSFPDQVLLMSMSRSPLVSWGGRFSPQSVQAPGAGISQPVATTAAAAVQVELPGGAIPLSTSKV